MPEFLTNGHQTVVVNGESSTTIHVDSGVLRGTVVGPLLLLLFINDLHLHVKSSVRLFTADALLYRCIESTEDQKHLQEDLASLCEWASTCGMHFNAKKCYTMRISRTTKPLSKFYTLIEHTRKKYQTPHT